MTNKEAIEIVNNLIILNKDEFYPDELEAFEKLMQTARDYDALIASDKNYTYEDVMNMALREK
jgi:flagellar biosynthesis regulator FlbT